MLYHFEEDLIYEELFCNDVYKISQVQIVHPIVQTMSETYSFQLYVQIIIFTQY